jgi:hypothetical protein
MLRRFVFAFAVLGLAIASAKTYDIVLLQPAKAGDVDLKPGNYTVEVVNDQAVIRGGKVKATTAVKIEAAGQKCNNTTVRTNMDTGRIEAICLQGTTQRLIFPQP